MLKRIYIDNYKSLVNFDLSLEPLNLLLGSNGTGKTSVFQALYQIQQFVRGTGKVSTLFPSSELTRWQTTTIQQFEIELKAKDGTYKYALAIDHDLKTKRSRIHYERLWFDGQPLLRFEVDGEVQLYRDDHKLGPVYPFDEEQSAVGAVPDRPDSRLLTLFKSHLNRIIIVQLNPMLMSAESREEQPQLVANGENFVSWYRYLYQDQGKAFAITSALQEIWPAFGFFKFVEAGERERILKITYKAANGQNPIEYRFDELSEGERALIVLYTLIYFAQKEQVTLCIDEPENFLALPEIQPWLLTLVDQCDDALQALLISHHPELIDYLAASTGYWFERDINTPTRVQSVATKAADGSTLAISDLVARGWLQ
jgi:predicted ATPase